jgi:SAM-dependent methyltransferase
VGLRARRERAAEDNYATDENLRKRASLLAYGSPAGGPQLWELFDWAADATVVDVGCGPGLWTSVAQRRTADGCVIGLDRSPGMLAALAAGVAGAQPLRADGHALPLREASVDVVLATWVLYHLPDKAASLGEVRRVLRPGGRLVAATNAADVVPGLDDLVGQAVEEVAGRPVPRWIEPLDFTLENGAEVLAPWFSQIERHVSVTDYAVPDPEPLVDYAASLRHPVLAELGDDVSFDDVLAAVARRAAARLTDGPLRFSRRVAFFVARA